MEYSDFVIFATKFACMKYLIYFLSLLFIFLGCKDRPSGGAPLPVIERGDKSPVPYSTDNPEMLGDLLGSTFRSELDFTHPEMRGEHRANKSYSFKIKKINGKPAWVIKEKYHDMDGKLYAGAEYQLLWEVVDTGGIEIVYAENRHKAGIRLRPTPGGSFLYRSYSNQPDEVVGEVIIGWYDRGHDAPLLRAFTYMTQLAANMDRWSHTE